RDPVHFHGADYVVMESTYGDRNHTGVWSYRDNLAVIIDETMARGGNLIIPSFAVGRTQELLYFIREIKDAREVRSKPDFEVYIDSPLARRATEIFKGDLLDYLDNDAFQLVKGGTHMFSFDGLRTTESVEESRELNTDPTPKVILSASGMCEAGRIRHHLKHNLWRPECTILFVGYQGEGTLGRTLLEGAESVKLFGEEIAVHAKIMNLQGMSSHADRDHLLEWITDFTSPKPQQVFVVHGDREVAPYFAQSLNARGIPAHAPQYTEVYDLVTNTMLQPGYLPARRPKVSGSGRFSAPYERLVKMGQILNESIKRSKGRDNKSLARFADQLKQLLEKWEA
ncbi:MAG: MBL fold metallo-hydrolase, partial [Oscillibacter sp.]|nr:MBL fold metallo-hydrolase [Oscillibacter sp.]